MCLCVCRGTLEDTELIDGLVFNQRSAGSGGPTRIDKAKIGLIQFCISPPKTDVRISFSVTCSFIQLLVIPTCFDSIAHLFYSIAYLLSHSKFGYLLLIQLFTCSDKQFICTC